MHANQKIGLFKAMVMMQCIAEINRVEVETKQHGTQPRSQNKICRDFGMSLSTVSKRVSSDIPYVSLEVISS